MLIGLPFSFDYRVFLLINLQKKLGFNKFTSDTKVVKISVVGNAMRTQSGIAKTMFETLAKNSCGK